MTDEYRVPLPRATQRWWVCIFVVIWAVLSALDGAAATLTVTNVNDSGPGSLREAIFNANANSGLDTITFQIPGAGVHSIAVLSALPVITDPVVIDGTTQPGYTDKPVIELNGTSAVDSDGLRLAVGSSSSTIRGLAINRFPLAGIHVVAPSATNLILGNFIGTDTNGTVSLGNGAFGGVYIEGSPGNIIGGTSPTNRNLISGNKGPGVYLLNGTANTIQGNLIGTSVTGTVALGNTNHGVVINSAPGNLVGGMMAGARNVISGNGGSGVDLDGAGATGNLVQGNYIGTDTNGSLAIPNAGDGVTANGARANTIGGTSAGAGNLLSGNSQGGVGLKGSGTDNNLIQGNLIGTDASGRLALGNTFSGITILGANSNLVGGTAAAARNVISANKLVGVYITTNSVGNLVQGNFIGVDVTGTNRLGNALNGMSIDSASFNTVGGTTTGVRNIISGNTNYGIEMFPAAATGNAIQGNYIGPDVRGLSALPNELCGIRLQSPGNSIGGIANGAGNLISGNRQDGLLLDGANAVNNLVQGNCIGTAAGGTSGLGNGRAGIGISGAPGNTIGGTIANAGNLISANGDAGIYLITSGATGNLIQGNTIGTDLAGNVALGNIYEGIYLERAHTNTIGGTVAGAGNLISGNKVRGIWLTNASWNLVQGNLIGTRRDGVTGLGNVSHAVECELNACNNTIGGDGSAGNTIAFTTVYTGVRIRAGSTNNAILGNAIFSNAALGIDLGTAGLTANDPCDADGGANLQQNFPLLDQAVSGNGTGVRGTLSSRPNATFLLQFFASPAGDPSGYGEGRLYLGQKTVVTDGNCTNSFVVSLLTEVPAGYVITATATDSANNTSEFSRFVPVDPVPALSVTSALAGHQIALAWTNIPSGFVLKQTSSLSPVIQWTTVTNDPVLASGQYIVTLSATTTNRFYVLSFE